MNLASRRLLTQASIRARCTLVSVFVLLVEGGRLLTDDCYVDLWLCKK